MSKDFDWHSPEAKESIVVPQVEAIAVYTNPDGNIVIRQQDSYGGEDHFVLIPRSNVNALIKALKEVVK